MKKTLWKKGLSLLLTMALLCGLMAPAAVAVESTYSDTKGNWAETSIERWSDYGVIQGNNGKFNPSGQLTRAHMAAILSRLLVLPEADSAGFKDVKGEWFADSINRCAAAGIMLGNNGYATPNATITRQQAVVMLARALGIQAIENPDLSVYTDASQVSSYAAGYMAAMAKAGIVKGTSNTTLSPYANITRAATVTILDRAIEVYANEAGAEVKAEGTGLVLVVADKVSVSAPEGTVVVVPAHVKNTVVNGEKVIGGQTYVATEETPAGGGGGAGGSGGAGGGGGSYVPPVTEDIIVETSKTVSGEEYQGVTIGDVTITDAVGDGSVTLSDMKITGTLTIKGGGSNTVSLVRCELSNPIVMDKTGGEEPRLLLTGTDVPAVEAKQPAIIESADGSSVANLNAIADVTIRGTQTSVQKVTVPEDAAAPIVSVEDGAKVSEVDVQSPAVVAADADAAVSNITAQADVNIASGAVSTVTVPATAENVEVEVESGAKLDQLNAQGAGTTISADGAVNNVNAENDVTVASGSISTLTVPPTAGNVEIVVGSNAAVEDLSINKPAGTTITNNGVVGNVSSDLDEAPEFTSDGDNAIDSATTHFHKWGAGVITTDATCTTDGVLTYTCVAEGCTDPAATKTHVILASGHKWGEWSAVESTDTHERVCENDATHKDIAAHTWNAGVITSTATCATAGEKLYTCTGCETTRAEVIPALGHDFDTDGNFDGKDVSGHWYNCNRNCGEKNVLSHTVVTDKAVAATCTDTGLTEGSHCSDCNYVIVKQTVVPNLGHDFTGEYSKDKDGHWHVCANDNCDVTDNKVGHTFDTTDCEKAATCTVCNYVKPAGQHAWNAGVVTTPATCELDGVKTFTCTSCSATKTEAVSSIGHTWGDWAYVAGSTTHTRVCANDRTHVESNAHAWSDWSIADDEHKRVCDICDGVERSTHEFDSASDSSCGTCGYERVVVYPVQVIQFGSNETMDEALGIKNDKVQIYLPGEPVVAGKLPVAVLRDGWNYKGWHFVVEDAAGNDTALGVFTEITAALESALKDAVNKGYIIYMDAMTAAEPIGKNGFDVTINTNRGVFEYELVVSAAAAEKEYFVDYVDVVSDCGFGGNVHAEARYYNNSAPVMYPGTYSAVQVWTADRKTVLATWKLDKPIVVQAEDSMISGNTITITVDAANSNADTYAYKISGLTTSGVNYWVVNADANWNGTVQWLENVKNGECTLYTDAKNALNGMVDFYGMKVTTDANGIYITRSKPVSVVAPGYDPAAVLNGLITEANALGLLDYVDTAKFTAGAEMTRLQVSMLAADLVGLTPANGAALTWSFTDGANLTANEKALIMALCQKGILAGYDDGSFKPDDLLTNAAIMKILDRALGEPLVPVDLDNMSIPVDRDHPFFWNYATLETLGVLNEGIKAMSDAAEIENVLAVFINGAKWLAKNPNYVGPDCSVTGVHMSDYRGPLSVRWNEPAAVNGIWDYTYSVTLYADNGNKMTFGCGSDLMMPVFGLNDGVYNRVVVNSFANGGRFAGSEETIALKLTVNETSKNAGNVTVYPTVDGQYAMVITGLTPNTPWHMFLGKQQGDYWMGYGDNTGSDGIAVVMISGDAAEQLKNGELWFHLREFDTIDFINGNEVKLDAVNRGSWTKVALADVNNSIVWGVSNIAFEDNRIEWTPSATQPSDMHYYVLLRVAGTDDNWVEHTGTSGNSVPTYTAPAGAYDAVLVISHYDGYAMAESFAPLALTVKEDATNAAPAKVTFEKLANGTGYKFIFSGLDPNKEHTMWLQDAEVDFWNRCGAKAKFDANGNAVFTFDYSQAIGLIGQGCYYRVVTCNSSVTSNDGISNESHFAFNGPWQFYKDEGAVNYEVTNIRFEEEHLVWDAPAVGNGVHLEYKVRLSKDGGNSWYDGCGTNNDRVASYAFTPGTYNKVRIATEVDGVEKAVVLADINLTITKDNDAKVPFGTTTFTKFFGDNNELKGYKMTVTGLQPNVSYIFAIQNERQDFNEREFHDVRADDDGVAEVEFWRPGLVENGYYSIQEQTSNRISADGKNCTTSYAFVGGLTKCLPTEKLWFEVENGSLYMNWAFNPLPAIKDFDYYNIYFIENMGEAGELVGTVRANQNRWLVNNSDCEAGTYKRVRLEAIDEDGVRAATNWFECPMFLTITEGVATDATVSFTETENANEFKANISDLTGTHNASYELGIGQKAGEFDTGFLQGQFGRKSASTDVRTTSTPAYYRLREFVNVMAEPYYTASFTIRSSQWAELTATTPVDYSVSNIHFDGITIRWDEPVGITNDMEYRVLLHRVSDGEWVHHTNSGGTDVPTFTAPAGVYDKVSVLTMEGGDNEVGCTHADLNLTVSETQASCTPDSVSFAMVSNSSDEFTLTVTGLTPNKVYMMWLSNRNDGTGNRHGTRCEVADGAGTVVFNMGGQHNLEMVNNGYYRIIEQVSNNVSATSCVTEFAYCCDWTKFESGNTGTDPVFGTPVLKTDGTFIWAELSVQNVADPSTLSLWVKNTWTYTNSSSSSAYQYSDSLYYYQLDGNTLKLYQVGDILVNQTNQSVQVAVKDPVSGIMSEYTANSLVYGTETRENINVTAVKVAASSGDKYNRLNITRADGSNFTAGHYQFSRPSTMDYTSTKYVKEDTAMLSLSSSNTDILGSTSVTPKKVVPTQDADGNIVLNKTSYNTYTFNDVVFAGITSDEGKGIVSAVKGLPVSLTMTIPSGVNLKTTTPTISCRLNDTTISNVVVNGSEITFDATFGNLHRDENTLFYLADTDTDVGYPLCTEMLLIDHIELLNITAQSNITELQLGFGEAVTFYNADGTAIKATDTATVHQQIANKIAVYKNGVDMGLTFNAGYTYGEKTFYFIYGGTGALTEDADYTVVFKDGVYVRSTSTPDKGYIGDINVRYIGPGIFTCQVNLSTGVMNLRVDAQDRVAETLPTMDFTKLSIACAPSGYWSYDQYQTDLVGRYTKVDGSAPTEKGTYTITKWVADNFNSGGYVYERRFWDLQIKLTDADLALYQSVVDNYNGTDQLSTVTHAGWMTGSANESLSGALTIMKDLTIQNNTDAYLYYDYSSNNHSASGSVFTGGTSSFSMNFAAETINLTYNGTKITVALPVDGVLVVTKEMFAQA